MTVPNLPNDLWSIIFLSTTRRRLVAHLFVVGAVCKSWYSLCGSLLLQYSTKADLYRTSILRYNDISALTELDCHRRVNVSVLSSLTALTSLRLGVEVPAKVLLGLTNLVNLSIDGNKDTVALLTNLTSLTTDDRPSTSNLTNLRRLGAGTNFKDEDLSVHTDLTALDVHNRRLITDDSISLLVNLTDLNIVGIQNFTVTDVSISKLTNLTKFSLGQNDGVTDNAFKNLTNLTHLDLTRNLWISEGISHLTNLTRLVLSHNEGVQPTHLRKLRNLTCLELVDNSQITDRAIPYLTQLQALKAHRASAFTSKGLSQLTNLRALVLVGSRGISDKALGSLSLLTRLDFNATFNYARTFKGVSRLTNLRRLSFVSGGCYETSSYVSLIKNLTNLTQLSWNGVEQTEFSQLSNLTNLVYLGWRSLEEELLEFCEKHLPSTHVGLFYDKCDRTPLLPKTGQLIKTSW